MKMRTEKQIYDTILNFAKADDRIRVVTLEGSRTNINKHHIQNIFYNLSLSNHTILAPVHN